LRILTVNVWTGLDYIGIFRMGEYEPRERRDARFLALVTQLMLSSFRRQTPSHNTRPDLHRPFP
jgi:hypothetical protein